MTVVEVMGAAVMMVMEAAVMMIVAVVMIVENIPTKVVRKW
jgi:hypothetical protein